MSDWFNIISLFVAIGGVLIVGVVAMFIVRRSVRSLMTRLHKLEGMRSDFVANVSHEVKTPVSAIKAAVETMQADPDMPREDAQRFTKIIARQADRLTAIVDDLLSLARIEQHAGQIYAELQCAPIAPVIEAACETCGVHAQEKQVRLERTCDPALTAPINAPLLEQATVNLIDNAIKYSPEDTLVEVRVKPMGREVMIEVIDEGRGVEPEHLPRLFERFYRTDKARSRAMGGTGLGLSIVKHVAEGHGARVSVDSELNHGSTFRIHLLAQGPTSNK